MPRIPRLPTLIAAVTLCQGLVHAAEEFRAEGEMSACTAALAESGGCETVRVRLDGKVKFTIRLRAGTFLGEPSLSANAHMDNPSGEHLTAIYHVAFLSDEGELVAVTNGRWKLAPYEDINYGSAIAHVSRESIAETRRFLVRAYVIQSANSE